MSRPAVSHLEAHTRRTGRDLLRLLGKAPAKQPRM